MADEIVTSFSKFRLATKEEKGVVLDLGDVAKCREECGRSLLGKIWGAKLANYSGLKNTLSLLWNLADDLKVVELGLNFFQFIFPSAEEKDRVLQKRPWLFDNQFLVLQQWRPDLTKEDVGFK